MNLRYPWSAVHGIVLAIKGVFGFTGVLGLVVGVHTGFMDDENEQRKGAMVAVILS